MITLHYISELKLDTELATKEGAKEGSITNLSPAKSLGGESDKEMVEVVVAHFESPSEFFLHLASAISELNQ